MQLTTRRVITALVISVASMSVWMCNGLENTDHETRITHPNGEQFAGSVSCQPCHQAVAESHSHTAHFNTSGPAGVARVMGNFTTGKNTFVLNPQLKVVMEKTEEGMSQTGFVDGWEAIKKPIDIVIGSGRKAQTFLYWENDKLFELPVSYYSPFDTWCNSPGYPRDRILFNRAVPSRCLECHGTYSKSSLENNVETFDKNKMILGVDCERCHGPSAKHVDFHTTNPTEKNARFVVNPAKLDRQLKLDNCALCHSGIRKMIQPSFSFVVGDSLNNFSLPDYAFDSSAALDVHGNQYGLLTASQCFKMSDMDCSSCHNVHVKETENLALFSQRCMTCHTKANHNFCTQTVKNGLVLDTNCIDCHMPALPSKQVFMEVPGSSTVAPDLVRTHLVGIYKEQIKKYIEKL